MKKRIIVISSVLLIFTSIGFVLSKNKKAIDAKKVVVDRSNIPVAVTVTKVLSHTATGSLQLPATLEPSKQAEISATTSGKISSLHISLGSYVNAGQVIGSVDTREQQINLKDAKEAFAKAQKDYQLSKVLFEGNAGTAQNVKDAERAKESARTKLQQISQQIGDARIKAPISGIISAKNGEVGEFANPGTAIATVVDIYKLKSVVFVSEREVYKLKLNQSATITADVLDGKSFNGKVSFISPVGDENHNYRVELTVNNSATILKAGTYVKVDFNLGVQPAVLQIPKNALVEGAKNPYVYVVNRDKAELKKISIGRELGENIEVISGLAEGDEVVISGQINLANDSRIERTGKTK